MVRNVDEAQLSFFKTSFHGRKIRMAEECVIFSLKEWGRDTE
jgi:hypothetical protein